MSLPQNIDKYTDCWILEESSFPFQVTNVSIASYNQNTVKYSKVMYYSYYVIVLNPFGDLEIERIIMAKLCRSSALPPPSPPCTVHNGPASQIARRTCAWKPRKDRKTETDIAFGEWGLENARYSLGCHLERIRALVNEDFGCFKWRLFYVSWTAWLSGEKTAFTNLFMKVITSLCIAVF